MDVFYGNQYPCFVSADMGDREIFRKIIKNCIHNALLRKEQQRSCLENKRRVQPQESVTTRLSGQKAEPYFYLYKGIIVPLEAASKKHRERPKLCVILLLIKTL